MSADKCSYIMSVQQIDRASPGPPEVLRLATRIFSGPADHAMTRLLQSLNLVHKPRRADERAGKSGILRLTLDAAVDLCDPHWPTCLLIVSCATAAEYRTYNLDSP